MIGKYELNRIYNEDCLEAMKNIPDKSIDMVLCDLPYGVTGLSWDLILPMDKVMNEYRRICKQNANVVLFCQQPFTTTIMNSIYKTEFSHSLVWKKGNKTRHLSSNDIPMSEYEEILVLRINKYANKGKHKELREYFSEELKKSKKTIKELEDLIPNRSAHHWFRFSSDYRIPTKDNYTRLQEITGCFERDYHEIKKEFLREKNNLCTYNPTNSNTNLLKYSLTEKRIHPTQKPVALLEELILRYSNKGELILDNTAGSGSTAIACINKKRKFIGFELDEDYYRVATERLEKHQSQLNIFLDFEEDENE